MKNTILPRQNVQDVLERMKFHNIEETGQWTSYGMEIACYRYAHAGKSPMEWAQAIAANKERHCIVCGRDQKSMHPWEVYTPGGGKRCICKRCRHSHTIDQNGNAVAREIK